MTGRRPTSRATSPRSSSRPAAARRREDARAACSSSRPAAARRCKDARAAYHLARAILGLVNLPMPTRNSWMHPSVDSILSVTRSL